MADEITRVVALGASNLTRGLQTAVSTARTTWGPSGEVLGAPGHGRSYGAPSRCVGRTLPGILQSGLWETRASLPPAIAAWGDGVALLTTSIGKRVAQTTVHVLTCAPPFRCCEAVVAEACFLMRKVHASGPADVVALGARGVYSIGISAEAHWPNIEALLKKYSDRRRGA